MVVFCGIVSNYFQYPQAYSVESSGLGSFKRRIRSSENPMQGSCHNAKICDISIREYKANVKPGSRKDSLSTLIASRAEDGTGLSHEELVGAAIIFIFAGNRINSPC